MGYPFPGSIDKLVLNLPGASVVNTFSIFHFLVAKALDQVDLL